MQPISRGLLFLCDLNKVLNHLQKRGGEGGKQGDVEGREEGRGEKKERKRTKRLLNWGKNGIEVVNERQQKWSEEENSKANSPTLMEETARDRG